MDALPSLREELVAALESASCTLDGSATTRIDTAALQLLAAFRRAAFAAGRTVRWESASDALRESAAVLGLVHALDLPANAPA